MDVSFNYQIDQGWIETSWLDFSLRNFQKNPGLLDLSWFNLIQPGNNTDDIEDDWKLKKTASTPAGAQ